MVDTKYFLSHAHCTASHSVSTRDLLRNLRGWGHISTEGTAGPGICYSIWFKTVLCVKMRNHKNRFHGTANRNSTSFKWSTNTVKNKDGSSDRLSYFPIHKYMRNCLSIPTSLRWQMKYFQSLTEKRIIFLPIFMTQGLLPQEKRIKKCRRKILSIPRSLQY